jgi:hypothetical protein
MRRAAGALSGLGAPRQLRRQPARSVRLRASSRRHTMSSRVAWGEHDVGWRAACSAGEQDMRSARERAHAARRRPRRLLYADIIGRWARLASGATQAAAAGPKAAADAARRGAAAAATAVGRCGAERDARRARIKQPNRAQRRARCAARCAVRQAVLRRACPLAGAARTAGWPRRRRGAAAGPALIRGAQERARGRRLRRALCRCVTVRCVIPLKGGPRRVRRSKVV